MSEDKLNKLYNDVSEIKGALLGDERYGQDGYKQRIERLESDVSRLAQSIDKIFHIAIGAGIASSVLVSVLGWLIVNWNKLFS